VRVLQVLEAVELEGRRRWQARDVAQQQVLVQPPQVEHLQHAVVVDDEAAVDRLEAAQHRRVPLAERERVVRERHDALGDRRVLRRVERAQRERLRRRRDLDAARLLGVLEHVPHHRRLDGRRVLGLHLAEHVLDHRIDLTRRHARQLRGHLLQRVGRPLVVERRQSGLVDAAHDVVVEAPLQVVGVADVRLALGALEDALPLLLLRLALPAHDREHRAARAGGRLLRLERLQQRPAREADGVALALDAGAERRGGRGAPGALLRQLRRVLLVEPLPVVAADALARLREEVVLRQRGGARPLRGVEQRRRVVVRPRVSRDPRLTAEGALVGHAPARYVLRAWPCGTAIGGVRLPLGWLCTLSNARFG